MILQFGTSRFLQAHVDLFAEQARAAGQTPPPILIVQTTGSAERAARLAGFSDPAGFPVILRGLVDGAPVEQTIQVHSVTGGLSVRTDWEEISRLFVDQVSHVVSNTGDTGFVVADEDQVAAIVADGIPKSFPAILLGLLFRRWKAGGRGVTILPCELVQRNGDRLRAILLDLAGQLDMDPAFANWLNEECIWANTLVDRIVSEPIEPAGAVAEPYALWAIERQTHLAMPFEHPDVIVTDDLEPYERLKLHILNLGHSWLAERWHRAGADPTVTVRAMLDDEATRSALQKLFTGEVQPGFARRGLGSEASQYIGRTIDRFANPYLDHRLIDIHSNHAAKIGKRIAEFVRWVDDEGGDRIAMTELRELADRYQHEVSR